MAEHPVETAPASRRTPRGATGRRRLAALALGAMTVSVSVTALALPGVATAGTDLPTECVRDYDGHGLVRCTYPTPGPGRFTVPAGVTSMRVGAGGATGGSGSGGSPDGQGSNRNGRGGSGAELATTIAVRPGDVYDFVVGTRGDDAVGNRPGAGGDGSSSPAARGGVGSRAGGSGGGGGGATSVTGSGLAIVLAGGGGGGGATATMQGGDGNSTHIAQGTFPVAYGIDSAAGGAGGGGGGGVVTGEHGVSGTPGIAGDGGYPGESRGPGAAVGSDEMNGYVDFTFADPDLVPPTTTTPAPTPGVACRGTARSADLCVAVTAPTSMTRGSSGTITTTVTNRGNQVARDVSTTLVVPGTLRPAAGPLTFRLPSLAPGQSRTYAVPVTAAQVMPNNVVQANVASRTVEPVLRNNFATASTTVTR